MKRPVPLKTLNKLDKVGFVAICGPLFEHSPWIAERAAVARPFDSVELLFLTLRDVVRAAPMEEKLSLIRAHPDLVGRLAMEGR